MDITNIYEYVIGKLFVELKKYLIAVTVEVSKQLSVDTVFFTPAPVLLPTRVIEFVKATHCLCDRIVKK